MSLAEGFCNSMSSFYRETSITAMATISGKKGIRSPRWLLEVMASSIEMKRPTIKVYKAVLDDRR